MNTIPDAIAFITRCQPAHKAHIEIINRAAQLANKQVIVLIGSANKPRTTKNPFKWHERAEMIIAALSDKVKEKVTILPLRDMIENDWITAVQETVDSVTDEDDVINIIGHTKDRTSYYLDVFPQWDTIEVENIDDLHATDIRTAMFEGNDFTKSMGHMLPAGISDYIQSFMLTPEYDILVKEYEFDRAHDRAWDMGKMLDYFEKKELNETNNWENDESVVMAVLDRLRDAYYVGPYEPSFNTVDMVVIQSGHVLLVRRRAQPGKGLYAIPGGYLERYEWSIDSALRELKEETKIKVAPEILRSNIKADEVFEDPNRSIRGRVITRTYIIELPPGELPKVKGSNETDNVKWVPFGVFEKMEDQMFEDHYLNIKTMMNRLKAKR